MICTHESPVITPPIVFSFSVPTAVGARALVLAHQTGMLNGALLLHQTYVVASEGCRCVSSSGDLRVSLIPTPTVEAVCLIAKGCWVLC
ncbi:hypothetical protein ABBQ32_011676 [Trebouxia sp. C0010 RCD-2024]